MADFQKFETGYLRYGKPPASGISHNYRDNIDEVGVSVYRAKFYADGTYQALPQNNIQWYVLTNGYDRDIYRVYGEEVGIGSDGEPVLKVSYYEKIAEQTTYFWYRGRYQELSKQLEPLSEYITITESESEAEVRDIVTQEAKDYEDKITCDKSLTASRVYEILQIKSTKPFALLSETERQQLDGNEIDYIEVANYN